MNLYKKHSNPFSINQFSQNRYSYFLYRRKQKSSIPKITALLGPGGGFFGVGTSELIVIGAVAWLVLGPKRLYQLAKDIGRISGEIKNVAEEAKLTFQQAVDIESVNLKNSNKIDSNKNRKENFSSDQTPKKAVNLEDLLQKEISELEKTKE